MLMQCRCPSSPWSLCSHAPEPPCVSQQGGRKQREHAPEAVRQGRPGARQVATAYGILEDPDKRRRYDAGGYASLEKADLEVEVDLSTLGAFNTAVAAMFSKLGVPIKTTVAPMVGPGRAGMSRDNKITYNS